MYDINSSIIYLVSPYSFKQDFSSTFHAHNISNWLNFPEILYYVGKKTPHVYVPVQFFVKQVGDGFE